MNLHSIASGCISSINPMKPSTLYLSDGYVTLRGGTRVPMYKVQTNDVQVQGLSESELRHVNELNIGGILRKVYVRGTVTSVIRADAKGGDLMTFEVEDGMKTWMCSHVLEQWPDWAAIVVQQQVVPVTLYHRIVSSMIGNGTIEPLGLTLVEDHGQQDYVITPDEGFGISSVLVDGEPIVVGDPPIRYSFYDVTADHTIDVEFSQGFYFTVDSPTDGFRIPALDASYTPTISGTIKFNSTDTITITLAYENGSADGPDTFYPVGQPSGIINPDGTWLATLSGNAGFEGIMVLTVVGSDNRGNEITIILNGEAVGS